MSKAEKLRGRLASIQRDREDFEKQKKELEEEMTIGRQNMGKIKKGLKNTALIEPIVLTESAASSSSSSTTEQVMSRKPSQRRESHAAVASNVSGITSPTNADRDREKSYHGGHNHGSSSSSASGTGPFSHANTAVIPSGPRVSEWCFTGGIDTAPPVVKSRELYENVRLLGRGSFGEVNLVKNVEDNKLFAIKTIFCQKDGDMQAVMHEVKFLRLSRHPCIIDIHDAFLMVNPKIMHIVMHYCESGSIASYISNAKKNKNSITEAQIIKWTIQLALALHFMHEFNHTLHRDLKPMNVMLTEGGDLVKLCDFGLALNMDDSNKGGDTNDEAGTPYYTAPEMIKGESYSYPADCWSFGVILHQLLTLDRPFDGSNTATLVKSILIDEPPAMPAHYSEDIKAISFGLLAKDPIQRISMSQLLADPFMYSKCTTFPASYRPKSLEERIRRSHCRTLDHQLERVVRTNSKNFVTTYKDYQTAKLTAASVSPVPPQDVIAPSPGTPSSKFRKVVSGGNINNSSGINLTRDARESASSVPPPTTITRDLHGSGIGFNSTKYSGHVDARKSMEGGSPPAMDVDFEGVTFSGKERVKSTTFNSIEHPAPSNGTASIEINKSIQFTAGSIAPHLADFSNSSAGSSLEFIQPYIESPLSKDTYKSLNDLGAADAGQFQFDSSPSRASQSVIADMESFLDTSTNNSKKPSPSLSSTSTPTPLEDVSTSNTNSKTKLMGGPPKFERQVTGNQDDPEKPRSTIAGPPKFERQKTGNQDDPEKPRSTMAGPPKFERQVTGNQGEGETNGSKIIGPPTLGRQITGPPALKRNITGNHTGSTEALIPITETKSTDEVSAKWTTEPIRKDANGSSGLDSSSHKAIPSTAPEDLTASKSSVKTDTSSSSNTSSSMAYGHLYGSSNGLSVDQESDLISEGQADMSLGSVDCEDLFSYRDRDNSLMLAIEEENTEELHASLSGFNVNLCDSPLNSSMTSQSGGRKGQEIASAKEKDTFYIEQQMNDSLNSNTE